MRVRTMIAVGGAAALAAVVGIAVPAVAGGGHFLTIEKVVVGELPPGTEFTIDVDCEPGDQRDTLTFPGPGSQDVRLLVEQEPVLCTVTEPGDGGATSVEFSCEDDGAAAECQDGNVIEIFEDGSSTITVTNTFEAEPEPEPLEPPAPEAVVVTPRFTG